MIDIERLRELAGKATPGEWMTKPSSNGPKILHRPNCQQDFIGVVDAEYIAAARPEVVGELIDRLEAAERDRELDMLRGMVIAAAIVATWNQVYAEEILTAAGVRNGGDLSGCAEYDIARLIEAKINVPGLHAAWQEARRAESNSREPSP